MFSSMLSLLGSLKSATTSFISNSLRFRSSASAYLSRTPSVAGNRKTWTWSGWVKRGTLGTVQRLFGAGATSGVNNNQILSFQTDNTLSLSNDSVGTCNSVAVYRDTSAWMHVVYVVDTTQAVTADRVKLYVNGQFVSWSNTVPLSLNLDTQINSTAIHAISRSSAAADGYFDGYLTEVNFIDGQALTPASFGAIDSSTGVWAPRPYAGTYGTNGFRLRFNDTSSVAALGTDSSGNGNNWTPTNVSLTAGATYDSMLDVPVNYADGGNGKGNYCVINPLDKVTTASLAAANLETTSAAAQNIIGSMSMDSGSWYWEIAYNAATASQLVGVYKTTATTASITPTTSTIGLRFNADTGALDYTVNGSTYTSIATGLTGGGYFAYAGSLTNAKIIYVNFGQRPFAYTPPAGFRALNTNNLPTPAIVNGANYMAATTYTGNAAARSLSNAVNSVSFQPDLVWIKSRTPGATSHALFDSVRGTTKYLSSNTAGLETTNANTLTAFGADGFSLGTDTTLVNANANSYIAWQWKAGGTAAANNAGSITSQVSANSIAGFSVVTYTGNGTNGATIGHGLGVAPTFIIIKGSSGAVNWYVWHQSLSGANYGLSLNLTNEQAVFLFGNIGTKTSSTLQLVTGSSGADNVNLLNRTYVAYCFAEIAGFSKFGSYTGNGSADGPFVFCGFRPRWLMIKRTDVLGFSWNIYDTARDVVNDSDNLILFADSAITESLATSRIFDLISNGFKARGLEPGSNATGGTYIFAAFAESPSKYALAR